MRIAAVALVMLLAACSIGVAIPAQQPASDGHIDCTNRDFAPIIDTVIAAASLSTAAYLWGFKRDNPDGVARFVGGPAALVGVGFGVSSGIGWVNRSACHRADRESVAAFAAARQHQRDEALAAERELRARQDASASAWKLAKRAETAAANGDCATATSLADGVRALDPNTYRCEYLANASVAACLGEPAHETCVPQAAE